MSKIKMLTVVAGNGLAGWVCVGQEGVTKIKDESVEWDERIDYIFKVYSGDKLVREIINCPVDVIYEED